jgi:hypothetical protein
MQYEKCQLVRFDPEYITLLDGDVTAALLLNQIVFWYRVSPHTVTPGKPKLRVRKEGGIYWLSKSHKEWRAELHLTRQQSRRAIAKLKAKGIIETKTYRFKNAPTVHVRLLLANGANHIGGGWLTAKQFTDWLTSTNHIGSTQPISMVVSNQSLTDSTSEITTYSNKGGGNFPLTTEQEEQHPTQLTGVKKQKSPSEWLPSTIQEQHPTQLTGVKKQTSPSEWLPSTIQKVLSEEFVSKEFEPLPDWVGPD